MTSVDGNRPAQPQAQLTRAQAPQAGGLSRAAKVARGIGRVALGVVTLGISEIVIRSIQSYRARQAPATRENARANFTLNRQAPTSQEIKASNQKLAGVYSQSGGIGKDFVDLAFADVRRRMGFEKPFAELSTETTGKLREKIKNRIEKSSEKLTSDKAFGIVNDEVMKTIAREMLLGQIEQVNSGLDTPVEVGENALQVEFEDTLADISKECGDKLSESKIAEIISKRAKNAVAVQNNRDLSQQFSSKELLKENFVRIAKEKGFNVSPDKFNPGSLPEKISMSIVMGEARNSDGSFKILSEQQCREIMEEKVTKMVDTQKTLCGAVDKMDAPDPVKEVFRQRVFEGRIKDEGSLKHAWALNGLFHKALNQFNASGQTSDGRMELLKELAQNYMTYNRDNAEFFNTLDSNASDEFSGVVAEISLMTSGLSDDDVSGLNGFLQSEEGRGIIDKVSDDLNRLSLEDAPLNDRMVLSNMLNFYARMQYYVEEKAGM